MPEASQLNTSHTVMRSPRTHGWPERFPGSITMRAAMPQEYHLFRATTGKPLQELAAWYRRIVINTQAQLREAFGELEGTFLKRRAAGKW